MARSSRSALMAPCLSSRSLCRGRDMSRKWPAILVLALVLGVEGCTLPAVGGSKAGGAPVPVTLRLANVTSDLFANSPTAANSSGASQRSRGTDPDAGDRPVGGYDAGN